MAAAKPVASSPAASPQAPAPPTLSAAERARIERNRQRARALRDARLVQRPETQQVVKPAQRAPLDTGGGFLLEEEEPHPAAGAVTAPPAPLQPHEQPACRECARRFPASYLLDTFDYNVCDQCRDEEGAHALLTRTEAKTEFLLKDCDLDMREPPLRFVRRPNPHRGARSDMRLYLRAQIEERALKVWGSEEALEEERAERGLKRARTKQRQDARKLRALRMAVRSSLYTHAPKQHKHRWGEETPLPDDEDTYSRTCLECGHTETYEKIIDLYDQVNCNRAIFKDVRS